MDEIFPWDFIDIGVTKKFLQREWERAMRAEVTPNCRTQCSGCGLSRHVEVGSDETCEVEQLGVVHVSGVNNLVVEHVEHEVWRDAVAHDVQTQVHDVHLRFHLLAFAAHYP